MSHRHRKARARGPPRRAPRRLEPKWLRPPDDLCL